ncbi:MAG TPA: glycosyltransferase, partial [Burkholderiaceae bacterium]|nr:glycosyltransferase [Burkholderiaceae bacterium]
TTVTRKPVSSLGSDAASFLLHISRMAPSKNIDALLALAAAWPDQRFVLAGSSSPYTSHVSEQVRQRALANVTLLLDIDDEQKAWLYARCSGFLFPSLTEGFGLPPLEAMHFGKPVFLSRLTSLPEVGGDAAHYFDSFEAPAMRRTIDEGMQSHQRLALATAVTSHARQFSWTHCAQQHVALYLELLREPRSP